MADIVLAPGPENDRKINRLIGTLGLEPMIARLPKRARVAVAYKRFGWFSFLLELQQGRKGVHSLIETEAQDAIFLHIPKTGGVWVAESLFDSHAASHTPLYMYLALYGARDFDRMFKFAFVRNPWTRLASAYHFLRAGGLTDTDRDWAEANMMDYEDINDFVETGLERPEIRNWVHFQNQTYFLRDPRTGRVGVDFLGRFETLRDDYAKVAARLGSSAELPHLNATKKTSKKGPALSARSIRRIGEIYHEDAVALDYTPPEV